MNFTQSSPFYSSDHQPIAFQKRSGISSEKQKHLLCRPRGGFNDTLCQIYKCLCYAEKHNRTLWVDTTRSGMLECLGNYFKEPKFFKFGVPDLDEIKTSFPKEIEGQENCFEGVYNSVLKIYEDTYSKVPLTFDFQKDYDEELLVHEQCGGGDNSIYIMEHLQFTHEVKVCINNHLKKLDKYSALHVRHSDYKTNYKLFFKNVLYALGDKKIVICTDSYECQQYALNFFNNLTISSEIPKTHGASLHENHQLDRQETNLRMFIDLMTLVRGERFIYTNTSGNFVSGFSRLVVNLRKINGGDSFFIRNIRSAKFRIYLRSKPFLKKILDFLKIGKFYRKVILLLCK
jgi:hypothetical protein